jgi:hypothetical protein
MSEEADRIVAALDLKPHREGGHYRETFRDADSIDGRAHSTAIYFLLKAGETSRWHRVDAVEVWHWYGGAPLELSVKQNGAIAQHKLGSNLANGERPQIVVPKDAWQMAKSLGSFTFAGCTVAPGFEFSAFELADGEPD